MKCKNCDGTGELEKMDKILVCPDCLGSGQVKWTQEIFESQFGEVGPDMIKEETI